MKKILIVEDETDIAQLYQRVLEKEYEVETAADGEEGLIKASKAPFDLIFMDIMMPKLNGFEALKKLKMIDGTKNVPVVMLTNLGKENAQAALDDGATDYYVKNEHGPFDIKALADRILSTPDPVKK